MPSSKNNSTPVSPPTSRSGLIRNEPPTSKGCKCTQSGADTTAEPAAKKPAITAGEETVDNSAKQEKKSGGRGRGGKKRGRSGRKTAGDKGKEDKAASNAANKEKSKVAMKKLQEMSISIAPPMQPKTAGASEITETSEITGAPEITETSEITGTPEITGTSEIPGPSEIPGTSEVLATTPSQSSESDDNNFEVGHASETKSITQVNDEENEGDTEDKDSDSNGDSDNNNNDDNDVEEEIEEMIIDEKNTSLAQVEEEDVDTMSIDSTLASDAIPTKKDLKGASRTTGGIFQGKAQGNNFQFADNMNESSSMVVNPQGFVYITVSDDSPKFNPTLLNTETPPQAVPTTPIMKDLHTMFGAAGTAWHHWDKVLKFLSNYPDMEEWLSTATPPDNKATHELWGLEKTAGFTRTDLENWIKKKKGISAGKGKQKAEGGKGKKGSGIKNK
ncbi:hypothetical protein BDQ17DRAFT_1428123 [Cyathus striatus]|nr:hypothetical protein BDQ17DRAFT_1428123 [Cyathus striatus]